MLVVTKLTDHFKVTYENVASMSYLVIEPGNEKEILDYQVEMIVQNEVNGMLLVDKRQKNGTNYLYYNVTSRMTLEQFLKRKRLTRDEFLDILASISKTLLDCKNYLLSDTQLVIEDEYIFINPATQDIFMVYIPIALNNDTASSFKEFIIDLITRKADIEESVNDNYLQRLLNNLKSEAFNVSNFQNLLLELRKSPKEQRSTEINISKSPEPQTFIKEETPPITAAKIVASHQEKQLPEENPAIVLPKSDPEISRRVNIPPAKNSLQGKNTQKQKQVSGTKREGYKKSTIALGVLSQVVLVTVIGLVLASGALNSVGDDPVATYGGLGIIMAALDFLLLKNLFDPKNKVDIVEKKKTSSPSTSGGAPKLKMNTKEIRNIPNIPQDDSGILPVQSRENVAVIQPVVNQKKAVLPQVDETSVLFPDGADETTFLGAQENNHAYLQGVGDGIMEQIPITKSSFIIGRLREQVDYVSQNRAIGKVHAEIIQRDGKYLLKDLNSRNGTYINNARIDSNKEYEIANNDKITFANSEYTFVIPSQNIENAQQSHQWKY